MRKSLSIILLFFVFSYVKTFQVPNNFTNCTTQSCDICVKTEGCVWCVGQKQCTFLSTMHRVVNCSHEFCFGKECQCEIEPKCENWLYPCSETIGGNLLLMIMYGAVLAFSAKMISDGSELLLVLDISPGIIGGFVLPVLGAVPDAAIILFSAVGVSREVAQDQISVGMGTLAGSTIMLMTIPFSLSLLIGRTNIGKDGKSIDGHCKGYNIFKQGCTFDSDVPVNALIAMITSFSYFILQGIAFYYLFGRMINPDLKSNLILEKWFAFGGIFVCFIFFVIFSLFQVLNSEYNRKKVAMAKKKHSKSMVVNRIKALVKHQSKRAELRKLKDEDYERYKIQCALKLGKKWKKRAQRRLKAKAKADEKTPLTIEVHEEEEEEEEEEYKDWPKWKVLLWAICLMCCGTGMVAFFSDPMVDVISTIGDIIGIDGFFVSFVVTPFCSNASELIASLIFASKKKRANSTIAFSQLYGAAIMNNTLCLGIFYILIFSLELEWKFSAETLVIFLSVMFIGAMGVASWLTKLTIRSYMFIFFISVYPLSLVLVIILEQFAGWD